MKKFLIAVAASLLLFGGQTQAAPVDDLNAQIETQETGTSKWANFRDKYILRRETENERNDRKNWESKHRHDPPKHRNDDRYKPPPPPPYYRDDGRHDGKRYYPPNPPPYYRDGKH